MNRRRGYALMFVIGITISLGVIVGGLFAFLAESVSSSKQTNEELQQLYGCDGALRLAAFEAQQAGANADIAALQQRLGTLATTLKTDLNPRTGRPYADLEGINAEVVSSALFQSLTDPFFGMQYVQVGSELIVEANAGLSRGRTCRGRSPNLSRTMSYFQFAAVSNDILLSRTVDVGSIIEVTAGTSGSVLTLQHSANARGGLERRRQVTSHSGYTVEDIHVADDETFRPVSPAGQPWSFVNKRRSGLFRRTRRRTHHRRPELEYFVKHPTHTPSVDPTQSRFAMQADIRIIDGAWYVRDAFGAYPGTRLWSDRESQRTTPESYTYSAYETHDELARGGAAIVRYGLVGRAAGALVPVAKGLCLNDTDELAPVVPDPSTGELKVLCAAGLTSVTAPIDPLIIAAQGGFLDPYEGPSGDRTPIMPIVFDVRALAASLATPKPGDLGAARCLPTPTNAAVCPEQRHFGGAIWIGTLPAGLDELTGIPRSPTTFAPGDPPDAAGTKRPCPLMDLGATGCVRPNAVVIVNADDLAAFALTGLSIGSNLPMYVIGHVNTGPGPITSRVALLAPSITGLSPTFDMAALSWSITTPPPLTTTTTVRWNTSIFTGWPSERLDRRDPSQHVLRRIEEGLQIDVAGAMVMMFRRQDYDQVRLFHPGPGSYSSPQPDPFVVGLPMFVPNEDNLEEEEERLAPGNLRYPGDPVRNLRSASIEQQPPAAPRFSIDPAPIDRR